VDGVLDPCAWPDLEVVEKVLVSTVGSDQREVRQKVILIGPRDRSTQHAVPMSHHRTVVTLARDGGATFR